jgi:uncharacterized protein (TIGR02246 family)
MVSVCRARVFAVSVACIGALTAPSAQVPGDPSEEATIRTMMEATTKAFSDHDAKAWARFCTPTARLVSIRGESMEGVAEIEKGLAMVFATRAGAATLRTLDISVRLIRPDVALAYVINEMSGLIGPDGRTQPPHRELRIRVVVKDNNVWKIAAFHNTMLRQ